MTSVCSKIRTPRSRQARRRPQASLAGWTSATPSASHRLARYVGEWTSAWVCSRSKITGFAAVLREQFGELGQLVDLPRLDGDVELAGTLELGVDPCRAIVSSMPSRFSRPSRSRVSNSSANRSRPLASPWVRLVAQKPPLRPDAAQPTVAASTSTTSRSGSASLAWSAVHSPV